LYIHFVVVPGSDVYLECRQGNARTWLLGLLRTS